MLSRKLRASCSCGSLRSAMALRIPAAGCAAPSWNRWPVTRRRSTGPLPNLAAIASSPSTATRSPRGPTVEVAHEALLRTWDRLREWLDASRASLWCTASSCRQRRVGGIGPRSGFLAGGARLAQFEALVLGDILLNREEQTYLQSSVAERSRREEAERKRQASELVLQKRAANRLRYLVAGMAVFLLVTAGLAAWALNQSALAQDNATVAQANANEASVQRQEAQNSAATAVANQEEADRQRQDAQTNFTRSEALRLAAEANVLEQALG